MKSFQIQSFIQTLRGTEYVLKTNVDSFAASVGTNHGVSKEQFKLKLTYCENR